MNEETIEKLKAMSLSAFAAALREQYENGQYSSLSFEERLSFLVDKEYLARENRKLQRLVKEALLKQSCSIEDIDFDTSRGLKRAQVLELANCTWIEKKHNLIITGPTGAGKTFLACALADKACQHKLRAKYIKTSDLARELLLAREDGSYPNLRRKLARVQVLLLDEWLRDPLTADQARELLDLLDDRFRNSSTLFVTQLPVVDWFQHIADPTLADAILDRVVHDAHRIELLRDCESMRKKTSTVN